MSVQRNGPAVADLDTLDMMSRFSDRLIAMVCALRGADLERPQFDGLELLLEDLQGHFSEITERIHATREIHAREEREGA